MSKESMDTSVIDLCDSDVEDGAAAPSFNAVAAAAVAARKTADADDDDDDGEHSSSSSDDDLWNAGLNKGPSPRKIIPLKSNNDDTNERETKRQKRQWKGHSLNSPIISLDIDDDGDDSIDSDSYRKYDFPRNEQNDIDNDNDSEKSEKHQPVPREINGNTASRKMDNHHREIPLKNNEKAEVECIEIDLSDDSSNDNMAGTKPDLPEMADTSHDCPTHSTKLRREKTQSSLTKTKKSASIEGETANSVTQTMKLGDVNDDSSVHWSASSDSLEVMPPTMTTFSSNPEFKGKKGYTADTRKDTVRLSFNEHDNNDFDIDHDPGEVDFSCDNDHWEKAEQNAKREPTSSLKDDVQMMEVDSDDSDNDSIDDEILTSRPFKVRKQLVVETGATKSDAGMKCLTPLSELATPKAYSPITISPTLGAYAMKRKVPTPAIPAMSASLVKEIGGKLYPDLRHNFVVALTSHARRLRHNAYQRAAFEAALRAIVVISLHLSPIRSAEAAKRIKGVGSNFYDLLKESVSGGKGSKPFAPAVGKYSCVATAALVALLELEEARSSVASANGMSFPMEDLIQKINGLLDARSNAILNQMASKYLEPDNLDPGWGQIKKLSSANADSGCPFVKERKKKDACDSGRLFELLDNGRAIAKKLRSLALLGPAEPGPLRQYPEETADEDFGNVTMSMDYREGGGGGKNLHQMCDQLDIRGVPYVVRELKIADYVFFVEDKIAPILIERKTAEDVASSLHDGRWESQQRSMRKAQYVLGGGPARRCKICYIIEGDAKTVHGGYVGRRTWFQSVEDVERAIEQLPSLGFSVMKSKSHLDTTTLLAKIAQDVSWNAKHGSIDAVLSYKEFLSRVKVLGDEIGDPPTSREHQNPAPPVVTTERASPSKIRTANGNAPRPRSGSSPSPKKATAQTEHDDDEHNEVEYSQLKKLSIAQLKGKCKERDEKISGSKEELVHRLLKPRKPEILIMRARRNEYVPKVPSCNSALLVALLLNHVPGTPGLTKEKLMVLVEETGVAGSESLSGDGGYYNGWSGMSQMLLGDPALVRKEKGQRFSLTTQPPETSGRVIANALHILAHREGICTCGNPPPE